MTVLESLNSEVMLIGNEHYRKALKAILQSAIDTEFLLMPAARSNHHPPDERLEGGLLLHTKRVLQIANIIMESCPDDAGYPIDRDGVRMACILHDTGRPVSHVNHPKIIYEEIMKMSWYDPDNIPKIANMALRHMGKWGHDLPQTREDWIVHLSDKIAAQYY